MSPRRFRRTVRADHRLCTECRARKARYRYRGHVRADRQHVLCFQCFRATRERMRAQQLAQLPFEGTDVGVSARLGLSARLGASTPSASLSDRQITHRQRMLAYLQTQETKSCARG